PRQVDRRKRSSRQVDDSAHQRLVERRVGVAETADAGAIAERGVETLAEHDRTILDRVVIVDVQITLAAQLQIEAAVLRESGQQVIEERHAGVDVAVAATVEVQRAGHVGLAGGPGQGGGAWVHDGSVVGANALRAAQRRSKSASSPGQVMRTAAARNGSPAAK